MAMTIIDSARLKYKKSKGKLIKQIHPIKTNEE